MSDKFTQVLEHNGQFFVLGIGNKNIPVIFNFENCKKAEEKNFIFGQVDNCKHEFELIGTKQTRAADESITAFFKCKKCHLRRQQS